MNHVQPTTKAEEHRQPIDPRTEREGTIYLVPQERLEHLLNIGDNREFLNLLVGEFGEVDLFGSSSDLLYGEPSPASWDDVDRNLLLQRHSQFFTIGADLDIALQCTRNQFESWIARRSPQTRNDDGTYTLNLGTQSYTLRFRDHKLFDMHNALIFDKEGNLVYDISFYDEKVQLVQEMRGALGTLGATLADTSTLLKGEQYAREQIRGYYGRYATISADQNALNANVNIIASREAEGETNVDSSFHPSNLERFLAGANDEDLPADLRQKYFRYALYVYYYLAKEPVRNLKINTELHRDLLLGEELRPERISRFSAQLQTCAQSLGDEALGLFNHIDEQIKHKNFSTLMRSMIVNPATTQEFLSKRENLWWAIGDPTKQNLADAFCNLEPHGIRSYSIWAEGITQILERIKMSIPLDINNFLAVFLYLNGVEAGNAEIILNNLSLPAEEIQINARGYNHGVGTRLQNRLSPKKIKEILLILWPNGRIPDTIGLDSVENFFQRRFLGMRQICMGDGTEVDVHNSIEQIIETLNKEQLARGDSGRFLVDIHGKRWDLQDVLGQVLRDRIEQGSPFAEKALEAVNVLNDITPDINAAIRNQRTRNEFIENILPQIQILAAFIGLAAGRIDVENPAFSILLQDLIDQTRGYHSSGTRIMFMIRGDVHLFHLLASHNSNPNRTVVTDLGERVDNYALMHIDQSLSIIFMFLANHFKPRKRKSNVRP